MWGQLSKQEKQEAERTKTRASQEGKQFVPWTPAIKRAFEQANIATDNIHISNEGDEEHLDRLKRDELYALAQQQGINGRSEMNKKELLRALKES